MVLEYVHTYVVHVYVQIYKYTHYLKNDVHVYVYQWYVHVYVRTRVEPTDADYH